MTTDGIPTVHRPYTSVHCTPAVHRPNSTDSVQTCRTPTEQYRLRTLSVHCPYTDRTLSLRTPVWCTDSRGTSVHRLVHRPYTDRGPPTSVHLPYSSCGLTVIDSFLALSPGLRLSSRPSVGSRKRITDTDGLRRPLRHRLRRSQQDDSCWLLLSRLLYLRGSSLYCRTDCCTSVGHPCTAGLCLLYLRGPPWLLALRTSLACRTLLRFTLVYAVLCKRPVIPHSCSPFVVHRQPGQSV